MTVPRLRALIVPGSDAEARFIIDVLEDHGDTPVLVASAQEALGELSMTPTEVAFVSLALPRGDGLALVHHIRALHPEVDVIVVASAAEIQDTVHAHALGVLHSVLHPLTGDAVLVAIDRARERRMLAAERLRLAAEGATSRRRTATYARCAAFVAETDLGRVARLVLDACVGECEIDEAVAYVASSTGTFVETARLGTTTRLNTTLDDSDIASIDPTSVVEDRADRIRIALLGDAELVGVIDLIPRANDRSSNIREGLEVVAGLATAAFQAARKVDTIARAGIKDPETSAYTFTFFGEVAGREIDRAARFGRRFALLTVAIDGLEASTDLAADARTEMRRVVTDAILGSVKDSDVVARVEDDEYYVLLPETSLLGALAARRRIANGMGALADVARFGVPTGLVARAGIASFPSDGTDLGRLLRTSRRRADRDEHVRERIEDLSSLGFWACVKSFAESGETSPRDAEMAGAAITMPRTVLPRLGATLTADALQAGVPCVIYIAGDDDLEESVASALDASTRTCATAWAIGSRSERATRIRLHVDDTRADGFVVLLVLGDLGGYALVGFPEDEHTLRVFHSSSVDLVDALVASLQSEYHLQPEVGE
jgi:two-component system cell cycle response regulator